MKPFLKWAGGKRGLLDQITSRLPEAERLVEPFTGSAALFLGTDYPAYLLADINEDLINLYRYLANEGENFINEAEIIFANSLNEPDFYYSLRARFNESKDSLERAYLFLYLNRHAYNGLCRYNSKGQFNVPFGRYANPYFPKKEMLSFVEKCRSCEVEFACQPFHDSFDMLRSGDVVYCDPPYYPISETSHFTAYSSRAFGFEDQQELARRAEDSGYPVLISNHDLPGTRKLYDKAKLTSFAARRSISCKSHGRKPVMELIASYNI